MRVQVVGLVVQVVPAFILFCGGGGGVHWVQVVQGAGAFGVLRCVFPAFVPAFRAFAAFALLQYLQNMPYFAF